MSTLNYGHDLFTHTLGLSGSWYLIALRTAAVATMLFAPKGLWPFISGRLGITWLPVLRLAPAKAEN